MAGTVLCVSYQYAVGVQVRVADPELAVVEDVRARFLANLAIDLGESPVSLRVDEVYGGGYEVVPWCVPNFDVAIDSQIAIYLVAQLAG